MRTWSVFYGLAALALAGWIVHGCKDGGTESNCGNGIVDRGETCDGSAVGAETCESQGFPAGGVLSCNTTCDSYDTSGCFMKRCGNGVAEAGEMCDGTDFAGNTCETLGLGYSGGTLACEADCSDFITTGCTLPGRGGIEGSLSMGAAVTCDASSPVVDCAGTVFLAVLAEDPATLPNQVPLAAAIVSGVDLGSETSVPYAIPDVPEGTHYLTAFLDDNSSDVGTGHQPDAGDPVVVPIQVTVTADATTQQDLVFGMRFQ